MELEFNKFNLIDVVEGLKKIKTESVDIIISDPRYNIGKDFGTTKDKMEMKDYLTWVYQHPEVIPP